MVSNETISYRGILVFASLNELKNYSFTFEMDGQAVKYIYEALADKHKRWAGGNAQQQADLEMLRDNFYRAYLDCILEKKAE